MNGCEELKRLDYFLNKQAKLIDMSLERQKLDEQRFRLGRIDVGQVIIAANDVITARFNFQLAQRSYATTVWSLLNIKGQLAGRMIAASKSPLLKGL
jgi:outer membrane protein TolC